MAVIEQTALPFPGSCVACGSTLNRVEDHRFRDYTTKPVERSWSGAVTWQCQVCKGLVCSTCALCKANSSLPCKEIFHVTYCSHRCREANRAAHKLGAPLVPDEEIWEDAAA